MNKYSIKGLPEPPKKTAKKLTDAQLSEFANFGGSQGSSDSLNNLNKRLLQSGFIDKNTDYYTSLAAPIDSKTFIPFKQANTIIPAIAMNAIMNAKRLGLNTREEFIANFNNVLNNPSHQKILADPNFKKLYPNFINTIAQVYTQRNNEYTPK